MLRIATVHWKDDRWVDIQLRYLAAHAGVPFKVYAWLNDLPARHAAKYHYAATDPIVLHAEKLNRLAEVVAAEADPSDPLLFIDGDAFPIADLAPLLARVPRDVPLAAIQRREIGGPQPHPSFCLTTVGFWGEIQGDWRAGYEWRDADGLTWTDVGGNLLGLLEARGVAWHAMLRTNRVNLHPVLYGIYEDLVYHHGAGFRRAVTRKDMAGFNTRSQWWRRVAAAVLPGFAWRALGLATRPLRRAAGRRLRAGIDGRNRDTSQQVFDRIAADPAFYRMFLEDSGARS